jgi:hypothetical protein
MSGDEEPARVDDAAAPARRRTWPASGAAVAGSVAAVVAIWILMPGEHQLSYHRGALLWDMREPHRLVDRDVVSTVLPPVTIVGVVVVLRAWRDRIVFVAATGAVAFIYGVGMVNRATVVETSGGATSGTYWVFTLVERSPLAIALGIVLLGAAVSASVARCVRSDPASARTVAAVSTLVGFSLAVGAIALTLHEGRKPFIWMEGRPRRYRGRRVAGRTRSGRGAASDVDEESGLVSAADNQDARGADPSLLRLVGSSFLGAGVGFITSMLGATFETTASIDAIREMDRQPYGRVDMQSLVTMFVATGVIVGAAVLWARLDRLVVIASGGAVLVAAGVGLFARQVVVIGAGTARSGTATFAFHRHRSPLATALGCTWLAAAAVWAAVRWRRSGHAWSRSAAAVGFIAGFAMAMGAVGATLEEPARFARWIDGRPRRHRGRRIAPSGVMTDHPRWAEMAESEAESVGAFLDLAARLEAVGADCELIDRCFAAAADERRHARLCDRQAGRFAPRPEPVAQHEGGGIPRSLAIAQLALESYIDGVLGEGMAAGRIERWAGDAPDPRTSGMLRSIGRDERRHAELAVDIVTWCEAQHPRLVRALVGIGRRRAGGTA